MTANVRNWGWRCLNSAIALLVLASAVSAQGVRTLKTGKYNPADQTVEMFAAIEKGDIAVKLLPKDSTECRVLIENKTDKPLNVKLPETFAGVPVLAQDLGGRRSSRSSDSSNNNNNNQMMGGGMGGMGMGGMGMGGMGGMGGGMGMFNVPPEKVGQIDVATVCLEHGKKEPHRKIPYEIKPLESCTAKPGVRELCASLGSGQIDQRAAQAAAWHLNNDMSWQQLATKRIRHANGASEPYFSQEEIRKGMQIAFAAVRLSEQQPQQSPGQTKPASEKQ